MTAANYSHVSPVKVVKQVNDLRVILKEFAPDALVKLDTIIDYVQTEGRAVELATMHANRMAEKLNQVLNTSTYTKVTEKHFYDRVQSELRACDGG